MSESLDLQTKLRIGGYMAPRVRQGNARKIHVVDKTGEVVGEITASEMAAKLAARAEIEFSLDAASGKCLMCTKTLAEGNTSGKCFKCLRLHQRTEDVRLKCGKCDRVLSKTSRKNNKTGLCGNCLRESKVKALPTCSDCGSPCSDIRCRECTNNSRRRPRNCPDCGRAMHSSSDAKRCLDCYRLSVHRKIRNCSICMKPLSKSKTGKCLNCHNQEQRKKL